MILANPMQERALSTMMLMVSAGLLTLLLLITVNSLSAGEKLEAALTSDLLLAIAKGNFNISDTITDSFAWDTHGAIAPI